MINEPTASRIAQRLSPEVHKIMHEMGAKEARVLWNGYEFRTKQGETVRIKITVK